MYRDQEGSVMLKTKDDKLSLFLQIFYVGKVKSKHMCAPGLPPSALICHFMQAEFLHHFIAFAPEILDNPLKE